MTLIVKLYSEMVMCICGMKRGGHQHVCGRKCRKNALKGKKNYLKGRKQIGSNKILGLVSKGLMLSE